MCGIKIVVYLLALFPSSTWFTRNQALQGLFYASSDRMQVTTNFFCPLSLQLHLYMFSAWGKHFSLKRQAETARECHTDQNTKQTLTRFLIVAFWVIVRVVFPYWQTIRKEADQKLQRPLDHCQASHARWDTNPQEPKASQKSRLNFSRIMISLEQDCNGFKDSPSS